MAPKSLFPSDQEEWIKQAIVEYIAKTAHGKLWEHGKPAPKDNSDLLMWVESKGMVLEKVFPEFYTSLDPQKLDIFRKKFTTKFRNAKNDEKEHLHKHFFDAYFSLPFIPTSTTSVMPSPAINPAIAQTDKSSLLLLNPVAAPTGCDLFIADQKAMINAKCKSLYDAISDKEKETWSVRAKEMEVGQDVYQSDANQVGNATFTLLWGFHDKHENVQFGSISAAPDGASCFSDDEVAWPDIANDWMKYCMQTLPLNRPVEHRKPAPSMSATTVPFPDFTEDTSISDLRNMVKTFLEKQWAAMNMGAIPWVAIEADRQSHINSELPLNLPLGDPEMLSKGNIIDLADYFKGRVLNVFLLKKLSLSSKDGESLNSLTTPTPNAMTKQIAQGSSPGGPDNSVNALWRKITGGGTAPPLSSIANHGKGSQLADRAPNGAMKNGDKKEEVYNSAHEVDFGW
ncbi:hypothetical protein EDD85DRAFT_793517 [Armillaria nabsnona]|nr:hypothetical protein EDD85DRAFT_793517 [Armillaria nabsnona]